MSALTDMTKRLQELEAQQATEGKAVLDGKRDAERKAALLQRAEADLEVLRENLRELRNAKIASLLAFQETKEALEKAEKVAAAYRQTIRAAEQSNKALEKKLVVLSSEMSDLQQAIASWGQLKPFPRPHGKRRRRS